MNFDLFGFAEQFAPAGIAPPTPADLAKGTRSDVGHLLRALGAVSRDDAREILSRAWIADRALGRLADPWEANHVDREGESLVLDLSIATNRQPGVSARTVAGLYLLGEGRLARCVARMLRQPGSSRRLQAAHVCDALTDPACLELFHSVEDFDSHEGSVAALRTICRLGSAAHLPRIEEALTHADESLCLWAIAAVQRLRPSSAVELLERAAREGRPAICVRAMTALGELGDPALIPYLVRELENDSSFRRIGAARGLTALALKSPREDFAPVLIALQLKARGGGIEYRRALESIRDALGIDPELPIPVIAGTSATAMLPIPDVPGAKTGTSRSDDPEFPPESSEEDSLSRRLESLLPPPSNWEYD